LITAVTQIDDFERQSGRIAENSGLSDRVRTFGAAMVGEHTKAAQDLTAAIEQAGLSVPPDPDPTVDQVQMMTALKYNVGKPLFDRIYMNQQVRVHQQALDMIQAYAQNGDNPKLRTAAANLVPTAQQRLATAQEVNTSLR
jgi:putative membrane protein